MILLYESENKLETIVPAFQHEENIAKFICFWNVFENLKNV